MSKVPTFEFDRYINGVLMAEGVTIERQPTFDKACVRATELASYGKNGEIPVLVYRGAPEGPIERDLLSRLIKWDTDYPVNCHDGYAGLKALDAIIADAKTALAGGEA